ncbi:glycosyltransferase family 4 protein [Paenibacillus sonchi]|uniref:glycosyltransferase family 4 protein n=1 Tax=Paenibacillus sonchi TaxID=373687 RepID=UPI00058552A8|nr:glycosyltransferase family 4 protein [Paenibacillus sonchi]
MRIAYFSPFNPLKSGISDYSEYLVEALSEKAIVDIWVSGFVPLGIKSKHEIYDYVNHPDFLENLTNYDAVIYNIGNNPYYHSHIYDVFLKYNGYVILHDLVLYYLITGYFLEMLNSPKLLVEEANYNGDTNDAKLMESILGGELPPLQFKSPDRLPLNKRVIEHAKGILVHSEYAKNEIVKVFSRANCWVIPQIGPSDNEELLASEATHLRGKYGIRDNDLIISSFGFVAESKRIQQVLHALSQIDTKNIKYLLVGEGDYVDKLIKKYKLESVVIQTGYTSIEEFDNLIKLSDIVVNLRYPYMGETSASMIRALLFGKPTIVTDIGWFSELPDDAIIKICYKDEEAEILKLKQHLKLLIENGGIRKTYSLKATQYAKDYLNRSEITNSILNGILQTEDIDVDSLFKLNYCDNVSQKLIEIGLVNTDQLQIKRVAINLFDIL